jgi:hypothetical protein
MSTWALLILPGKPTNLTASAILRRARIHTRGLPEWPTRVLLHFNGILANLFLDSFPALHAAHWLPSAVPSINDLLTDALFLIPGNTQYTLFFSNDGDGLVDLYLRNADSDQVKGKWNATRQSGALKLLVNDTWWDNRAVDLWTGQPRNWTFYWVIVPSGTVLNGGEVHQPTFTVVQTALPDYAISSSSASMASASMNSASRSLASEDSKARSRTTNHSQTEGTTSRLGRLPLSSYSVW